MPVPTRGSDGRGVSCWLNGLSDPLILGWVTTRESTYHTNTQTRTGITFARQIQVTLQQVRKFVVKGRQGPVGIFRRQFVRPGNVGARFVAFAIGKAHRRGLINHDQMTEPRPAVGIVQGRRQAAGALGKGVFIEPKRSHFGEQTKETRGSRSSVTPVE
jgi:hypothetical protein